MTMWEVDKKGDNSIFFETSFGIAWRAEKEKFIHLSEREIPAGETEVASARAAVSAAHCAGWSLAAQPPKEIGKDQI